jgi:hypothetical protein
MAIKKPLVITNGQIEQLQSGDQLQSNELIVRTNANASPIVIGQPVYVSGAGSVDLALADAQVTSRVLGLVAETSIAAAASGGIQTDGVIVATTGEWDTVTGETGGLTAGALYFLDPDIEGMLTQTAPTLSGDFVAEVGMALSTTELEISIRRTVRL